MYDVAIIGAGPAGMTAALEASKNSKKILLLEKNSQAGRKLRVTGGGRGNLTNQHVCAEHYFCSDPEFVRGLLAKFGYIDLHKYLTDLGVATYQTDDGWVYPKSNSAANVADLFESLLVDAGVNIRYNVEVKDILKKQEGFRLISGNSEKIDAQKLIIASGGRAYPELGSSDDLFAVISRLGHTVRRPAPALAPLLTEMKSIHKLQGLRLDVHISIWIDDKKYDETTGNIILTNWGINGPGVMDLSHWVSLNPERQQYLRIDFLPGLKDHLRILIEKVRSSHIPLRVILGSVLPPKAARFFVEQTGLQPEVRMDAVSDGQISKLLRNLSEFRVDIKGTRGFDFAQVASGGIPLEEIDHQSMMSKIVEGLFFAGEIIDVIGHCGGYNLHWAFASGVLAGRSV